MEFEPTVKVEFYGVIRLRAGVAGYRAHSGTLGSVFRQLEQAFPALAPAYLHAGQAKSHLLVSRDGTEILHDPATPVRAGDCLVFVSAQAGG